MQDGGGLFISKTNELFQCANKHLFFFFIFYFLLKFQTLNYYSFDKRNNIMAIIKQAKAK